MLLFQNWSQVLSNLSLVTSVTPPAAVRIPAKRRDQSIQADVLCSESFQNSLHFIQSSDHNIFSVLPKHFFNDRARQFFSEYYLTVPKNTGVNIYDLSLDKTMPCTWLRKIRNRNELTIPLECHAFVSRNPSETDSFLKGMFYKKKIAYINCKRPEIFKTCTLSKPANLSFSERHSDSLTHQSFAYSMQRRTFKTERNLKAELERNPGILSRIKNALYYGFEVQRNEKTTGIASQQHPSFKKLIADETISPEEKCRVAYAFAEGYAANKEKPSTPPRIIKFLGNIFWILLAFVIYNMANGSFAGGKFILNMRLRDNSEVNPEDIDVTLDDVRGAEEAKRELQEVVEFLKNPEKFSTLGGKLPKGVLLIGPPGTGKTLLARAVAGEAGVPFFHAAGPEFDEILVGQGARRVRDLFRSAKAKAPCVIFIDEIDSVGAKRANSVLHPYASQTINQLLTEMDGFHKNQGVIVIGATNRKNALDKALLRPGRFDVEVNVPVPDLNGRKEIFDLYLGKILCKNIDIDMLARGTIGFTGADIENMVNQAAVKAASDGADFVTMEYLDYAKDKLIMGPERRSMIPDEETNLCTAYHESGHALVAYYTKDSQPIYKITIVPRNESLGHTELVPDKEVYQTTKAQLLARLDSLMGGRAAEELIFGPNKVTTGASSDLEIATSIAERMVKDYGMSEKVGLRSHAPTYTETVVFNEWGQTTSDLIDVEIRRLIQESYERAKNILREHAEEHKLLAEALLKYETLNAEEVKAILRDKGKKRIKHQ